MYLKRCFSKIKIRQILDTEITCISSSEAKKNSIADLGNGKGEFRMFVCCCNCCPPSHEEDVSSADVTHPICTLRYFTMSDGFS